jgi:5-(carboxyamino)imidazole ribonucleotide synthase
MTVIPPGSTIGILGSGQLGRMLGMAAAQLGYRIHVFAPESGPACDVASAFTLGEYEDWDALRGFAEACDVLTYEFENVSPHAVAAIAGARPIWPSSLSLDVSRYRVNEKEMAESMGGTPARWRGVGSLTQLDAAIADIGTPAILKTTMFGYDGKGQARVDTPGGAEAAWKAIGAPVGEKPSSFPAILERRVDFFAEFSVILCRGADGAVAVWDAPENVHRDGILHTSTLPASDAVRAQAGKAASFAVRVAERLGHVGVLTLEFFATEEGPVFNEMAPRVHNSGHWTIEGAETSQFENHIRAICGLPLGSTALTAQQVAMENLIGDEAERWPELTAEPGVHLHLYGKHEIRAGRKMGHVTRLLR